MQKQIIIKIIGAALGAAFALLLLSGFWVLGLQLIFVALLSALGYILASLAIIIYKEKK